ncbi:transposase [Streptomyces olivoreticuli]|uniref:transposase n=1 Tax=Streptomyces olivoreticuli TaxID=68246 RepID=UPI003F5CD43F
MRWRTRTGAPWRDVPIRYGEWETVYGPFRRWQRDGTRKRILKQLPGRRQRADGCEGRVARIAPREVHRAGSIGGHRAQGRVSRRPGRPRAQS